MITVRLPVRAAVLVLACLPVITAGQGRGRRVEPSLENLPYDGTFVFTRIRYGSGRGWGFYASAWNHDYPRADRHLPRILAELTTMRAATDGSNVLTLDDPEIFLHPVIYLSEPGFWSLTASEAQHLRSYLLKGGFIIFDDFEAEQWHNFAAQLGRALPEYRLIQIDVRHPIFRAFFEMKTIDFPHPLVNVNPTYYGIFEGNDPARRMLGIVNYNNDIAEYWEWSDTGMFPIAYTNDAYKLGVNYIVYAMTH